MLGAEKDLCINTSEPYNHEMKEQNPRLTLVFCCPPCTPAADPMMLYPLSKSERVPLPPSGCTAAGLLHSGRRPAYAARVC